MRKSLAALSNCKVANTPLPAGWTQLLYLALLTILTNWSAFASAQPTPGANVMINVQSGLNLSKARVKDSIIYFA
jgi:hypothetical protein